MYLLYFLSVGMVSLIRPGRRPGAYKLVLPELVSCLGERGVPCVSMALKQAKTGPRGLGTLVLVTFKMSE